jgi:hypothetical protein
VATRWQNIRCQQFDQIYTGFPEYIEQDPSKVLENPVCLRGIEYQIHLIRNVAILKHRRRKTNKNNVFFLNLSDMKTEDL